MKKGILVVLIIVVMLGVGINLWGQLSNGSFGNGKGGNFGGPGPSSQGGGSPFIQNTQTNFDNAATSTLSVTMPTGATPTPFDFAHVAWYTTTGVTISSITDNGNGMTLYTNGGTSCGDGNGKYAWYYYNNPANVSRTVTVTFSGNTSGKTMQVLCITNMLGTIRAGSTNCTTAIQTTPITNTCNSASGELVLSGVFCTGGPNNWNTITSGFFTNQDVFAPTIAIEQLVLYSNSVSSAVQSVISSDRTSAAGGCEFSIK